PIEIIKAHRYMRKLNGRELPLASSLEVLETMHGMNLAPVRVDLAKVITRYWAEGGEGGLSAFVQRELAEFAGGPSALREKPQDVVLYGFGRIGRILARILVDKTGGGNKFRLRAVVVRKQGEGDIVKRASLLRRDSVHGHFLGSIEVLEAENAMVVNGNYIQFINASSPESVDYTAYGIDDAIIIDNTGAWRDRAGLGRHLEAKGVSKVLLTAPGKGDLPNVVFGVNHGTLRPEERLVSAASCTTNAIVPVLKVMNDRYGIKSGHVETIHSFTNDQNLIDNFHKKERRGRSAPLNMVITETGAASAIAKALPELTGKITGNAIRVPTPNVSLAILNLELDADATKEEVNAFLRQVSMDSPLASQIDFTASPDVVSTDLVGNPHATVVDSTATIVHGRRCT
ncbi:MAG: glyceraldehyde-3-phosphate dehydrogenase, partial [Polyangiaceae bacterium]|nr:glyceraldehyde-3-phosphate dehydrogenase [Polyangiaceae bacterium]